MSKKLLYLGANPQHYVTDKPIVHMPLVEVVSRDDRAGDITRMIESLTLFSHLLFANKNSVRMFFSCIRRYGLEKRLVLQKCFVIALGRVTAYYVKAEGLAPHYITPDETEACVTRVLSNVDLSSSFVLVPKSSNPIDRIIQFLSARNIRHHGCVLYDVRQHLPAYVVPLDDIDEVVFTDPLTVRLFFELYKDSDVPVYIKLHPIGFSTRLVLIDCLKTVK